MGGGLYLRCVCYFELPLKVNFQSVIRSFCNKISFLSSEMRALSDCIAELETENVSLKQELDKQQKLINSILEKLSM